MISSSSPPPIVTRWIASNNNNNIIKLIIDGYLRRMKLTDNESIRYKISLITCNYFESSPLYLRDPNVPAPPQRTPPSPLKSYECTDIPPRFRSNNNDKKEENKKENKNDDENVNDSVSSIEGKYQQIFDIYRDRLDFIECKMNILNNEFDVISATMNTTLMGLEQRRINDINTIQKQFNSTITALCYQINEQINNQIKMIINKLDISRKENKDRINNLEQKLNSLKKENDILRKKQKINKILKGNNNNINNINNNDDINGSEIEITEIEKVKKWLTSTVRLPQYYLLLINNGYDDLESIHDVTFNELEQIGIDKMGHRKKIIKYAQKLINNQIISNLNINNNNNINNINNINNNNNNNNNNINNNNNNNKRTIYSNSINSINSKPTATMSPNSVNGGYNSPLSGHSSLYSHNIWSDDSVSSIPWTYTQNQQQMEST